MRTFKLILYRTTSIIVAFFLALPLSGLELLYSSFLNVYLERINIIAILTRPIVTMSVAEN